MNDSIKDLETRLHSWTPRRPSAGLRARIFARPAVVERQAGAGFWWVAPGTGCLMLWFVTLKQRNSEFIRLTGTDQAPLMAVTLSNMSFAAYLPGSFANVQNAVRTLQPVSFEWTNRDHSPSSIPSFPQAKTKYLR